MEHDVFVVSTGTANLASVKAAFERIASNARIDSRIQLVQSAREIERAGTLVLPGVGAFAAAMKTLQDHGFVDALRDRIAQGRKTLCVCLGMQLLANESEESPQVEGLGIFDAKIRRFRGDLRVPHIGWNRIEANLDHVFLQHGVAYFANSYYLPVESTSSRDDSIGVGAWKMATCHYGSSFAAALEYEQVLACQFHPELSGAWGEALLRRWWLGNDGSIRNLRASSDVDRSLNPGSKRGA